MSKEYYNNLALRAISDETAFVELYEYFFPRVYNFIFARLKSFADADDVTSVTFIKMTENLTNYNPDKAAFSTWLFRIATNSLIDHTRLHSKTKETEWDDSFESAAPENEEPESVIMKSETSRELLSALNKLNERELRIIELKFWGGLDSRRVKSLVLLCSQNLSDSPQSYPIKLQHRVCRLYSPVLLSRSDGNFQSAAEE